MRVRPDLSRRDFVAGLGAMMLAPGARRDRGPGVMMPVPAAQRDRGLYAMVLGAVQDGGLPQAGCYSPRCNRARLAPRFVASLALVEPGSGRFYLVDASPDLTRQVDLIPEPLFRERAQARRPFDGIFLTHAHIGHYLGLALLGREGVGTAATPCYCTREMATYLTDNGPWSLMVEEGRLTFPAVPLDEWFRIDELLSVKLLPVPHRHEFSDTVAFVFRGPERSLLYLPDIDGWDDWDRRIEDVVGEVDVAMVDGAFYSPDEVPGRSIAEIRHPMIPDTARRLEPLVARGKQVVFTHLNNTNVALDRDSPEARDLRRRGFVVAHAGQRYDL